MMHTLQVKRKKDLRLSQQFLTFLQKNFLKLYCKIDFRIHIMDFYILMLSFSYFYWLSTHT